MSEQERRDKLIKDFMPYLDECLAGYYREELTRWQVMDVVKFVLNALLSGQEPPPFLDMLLNELHPKTFPSP